jgi:hypothetical protein
MDGTKDSPKAGKPGDFILGLMEQSAEDARMEEYLVLQLPPAGLENCPQSPDQELNEKFFHEAGGHDYPHFPTPGDESHLAGDQ